MKTSRSKVLQFDHPMATKWFLLAALLTLFLLIPNMEALGGDAPGCPHASKKSQVGCPYKAAAQGAGVCPCMKAGKGCLHALKGDLKPSEEQVKRIKEIRDRFEEQSADLKAKMRKQKEELDGLFRDPDAGTDKILAGQKALFSLKKQMGEMAMDSRLKIRAELTADQIRGLPEGCWRGLVPSGCKGKCGCGGKCKGHKGGHTCPYKKGKKTPAEDSPA